MRVASAAAMALRRMPAGEMGLGVGMGVWDRVCGGGGVAGHARTDGERAVVEAEAAGGGEAQRADEEGEGAGPPGRADAEPDAIVHGIGIKL